MREWKLHICLVKVVNPSQRTLTLHCQIHISHEALPSLVTFLHGFISPYESVTLFFPVTWDQYTGLIGLDPKGYSLRAKLHHQIIPAFNG